MTKEQRRKKIKEVFSGTQLMILHEDMRDEIKILAECVSGVTGKVDSLGQRFDNLETKVDNLEAKVTNLDTKATNLDIKVTNLDARLDNLDARFSHFQAEMYDFKDQTDKNFKFVAKQLFQIDQDIDELKNQHQKGVDAASVLREIKRIENEIVKLKKKTAKKK